MTSAWKSLETLTAWSDDLRLSLSGGSLICTFTFFNIDEFHLWQDYNRDSAMVYSYSADFLGRVVVQVDISTFMKLRFKYGMRKAPPDNQSSV